MAAANTAAAPCGMRSPKLTSAHICASSTSASDGRQSASPLAAAACVCTHRRPTSLPSMENTVAGGSDIARPQARRLRDFRGIWGHRTGTWRHQQRRSGARRRRLRRRRSRSAALRPLAHRAGHPDGPDHVRGRGGELRLCVRRGGGTLTGEMSQSTQPCCLLPGAGEVVGDDVRRLLHVDGAGVGGRQRLEQILEVAHLGSRREPRRVDLPGP